MDADTISTLFCEPVEELRETHISQVYLTKNYALKRKKEVTLPFVDYSTCQMRLQNCLAEIELNRRLSSGVYLGCMVLINDSGRWRWSGSSAWSVEQEIGIASPRYEPLVIMRRLPDTHLLSRLAASGDPRAEDCLPALARKLAGFHRRTALSFSELSDPATVLRLAGDNFRELEGLELNKFTSEGSALAYSLSKRYTERFITDGAASISARARAGCISDGHGDLRLEHVSLEPDGRIQIIDCVEFDAGLRRLDRLCDLAFLLMDLDHSSRPDLTARLLSEYCTGIDEDRPAGGLQFFKCY
ncbi:MAG: hypothetical protein DCC75_11790, partial [Proteobacteria bacterium]